MQGEGYPTKPEGSEASVGARRGTGPYRRISTGLVLAGFSSFSLLYCTQPLLPMLSRDFAVSAAASSLSLSVSTGCLALSILFAGALSESVGRKSLMAWSMCIAALLNLAAAFAPAWEMLLVLRALEGIALGGVPAVGMAYLGEEIEPRGLGFAMGLYVAGNAFGGMTGRVLSGIVADHVSWQAAMAFIGILGLASAFGFLALLPPSRNFDGGRRMGAKLHVAAWLGHLRHPGLRLLFLVAFLMMGSFVTIYNYAGFRLEAPPFELTASQIGAIFVVYLFGMAASSIGGGLADKIGRPPVVIGGILIAMAGLGLTLLPAIPGIVGGIALVTIGFFAAHSVASGWVSPLARGARGHASALYLLAYYLGSSVLGSVGGWFWTFGGWPAVAGFVAGLLGLALAASLVLAARFGRPARPGGR
jgi:YNFM family putative membrane transporter